MKNELLHEVPIQIPFAKKLYKILIVIVLNFNFKKNINSVN